MRRMTLYLLLANLWLMTASLSFAAEKHLPKAGVVPDEATAIKIAEAVLLPLYGEDEMVRQRPLIARFDGKLWTVMGRIRPSSRGNSVIVIIAKKDGRILRIGKSV